MIRAMMGKKKQQGIAISGSPNGVYTLRTDNLLYKWEEWDTQWNANASGVAVISDKCKFVIAPDIVKYDIDWRIRHLLRGRSLDFNTGG